MTFILNDKAMSAKLNNALDKSRRQNSDSLSKLSSGQVFTAEDPRPADRALAEGLEHKLRGLAASKRNINDGISLLQTAESGFSEISNMLIRMKEINTAAASSTLSNQDRKFLFIEYQALHEEVDRIAATTEFNKIPLLDGSNEKVPEELVLRIGDAARSTDGDGSDLNTLRFQDLKKVIATTTGLGLKPVADLLAEAEEGIDREDAQELLEAEDSRYGTVYDEALDKLSGYRAMYGAMQTRLAKAIDYNEVVSENISAARSKIADVDYADEVAKLTQSNILMQTATALMTQNNLAAGIGVQMIQSLLS